MEVNSMDTEKDSQFEDFKNKTINGKVLSFKTGDIARMIGEKDQTIRNYCIAFEDFLGMEHKEGEHRIFSQDDLDKFIFIKYLLKEKNYSIKQAKEYLSTPEGKSLMPIEELNENNKMKLIADMMTENLKPYLSTILKDTVQQILQNNSEDIKNHIDISISNNSIELKNEINNIKDNISKINETNINIKTDREQLTESMIKIENMIQKFQEKSSETDKQPQKRSIFNFFKKK
jgi:DNA-binding transcriptional MerR regulator